MTNSKKAKMAIPPTAMPGIELDGKGEYILLEERTEEDQEKVRQVIKRALPEKPAG